MLRIAYPQFIHYEFYVPIDAEHVVEFVERWTPLVVELGATFFEATTAMAFDAFARADVDVALIETGHFFRTNKEATQKLIAKYLRGANKAYLDSSYESTAKLIERVPYTTREGMKIQLDDALKQNPGSKTTIDNLIDDSIVREIEKEGFIDKIYGKRG